MDWEEFSKISFINERFCMNGVLRRVGVNGRPFLHDRNQMICDDSEGKSYEKLHE